MKPLKTLLETIDEKQAKAAKAVRDAELVNELEVMLKEQQAKLMDSGDLENPKDVKEMADVQAKLLMLPAKRASIDGKIRAAASGLWSDADELLYHLKAVVEKDVAATKKAIAKLLQPYNRPQFSDRGGNTTSKSDVLAAQCDAIWMIERRLEESRLPCDGHFNNEKEIPNQVRELNKRIDLIQADLNLYQSKGTLFQGIPKE